MHVGTKYIFTCQTYTEIKYNTIIVTRIILQGLCDNYKNNYSEYNTQVRDLTFTPNLSLEFDV